MRKICVVILMLSGFACKSNLIKAVEGETLTSLDSVLRVNEEPPAPKEVTADQVVLVKELLYDKYTLEDEYPYKDTTRVFQWDKIKEALALIETMQLEPSTWAVLQNRKNVNGEAPLAKTWVRNAYTRVSDTLGVERYQSVPLYALNDTITPVRYGNDGSWVRTYGDTLGSFIKITHVYFESDWYVPKKYVKNLDSASFYRVAAVDRANQNISTLERSDSASAWLIRSMNPATTGVHNPPYAMETPLGIFVVQEKKPKMLYTHDGSSALAGYAPNASRFSNGGYIHGVPTNNPNGAVIEYSYTLGTTPRSHMCVRNATSHAKFVYDWAPAGESLVLVLE